MARAEHPIWGAYVRPRREPPASESTSRKGTGLAASATPPAPARPESPAAKSGELWPGPRYARLIERLRRWIGREVHVSVFSFNGSFLKEGQPYRLLDVVPYPAPQSHPHPAKRAYPHMLVLGSERPEGREDAYWRNGELHGGAINLAHVGSITASAFPEKAEDWVYGNLDLLSRYYGRPAAELLEEGLVPARALMAAPDSVWLTRDDNQRIAGLLESA
ncbi:MAG: hypothetical protein ACLFMY_07040 [Guyparkeria sp.]|uniref:hypothetical protein n=1 Tax=Guyparkeria sp. TaxID=2035736 RepID=UPI00397DFB21